jgi:succinoglycan biosynthesis protein ExoA
MASEPANDRAPARRRLEVAEAARPRISVIAPMRNESEHVEELVADLAAQDIDEEFEVLIADGGSTDGSPERLRVAAARAGLRLKVLDNPRGFASPGLNICIRVAVGELIVRLDCHTRYPADYVRLCVEALRETGAWNASGVFTPIGRTRTERAVACALDSPFGGHNWTRNVGKERRVEVDTNYLGAFPKAALERIGMYDEELVVGEVEDVNLALRKAGGKVLLDPRIRSFYYPRGTFAGVFRQYFRYGFWKLTVMKKHGQVISGRSAVPALFILSLLGLGVGALFSSIVLAVLLAELALYAAAAGLAAAASTRRRDEPASLIPRVAAVFPLFHLGHGLGTVSSFVAQLLGRGPRP